MNRTISYIESKIGDDSICQIDLIGDSKAVNKVISIAEFLKRTHPELTQDTYLDESPEKSDEPRLKITLNINPQ